MGPIGISVRLCAAAFLMAAIAGAVAQDADKGRTEYMENCAGCHGADAKGAGPLSAKLKTKPTDLTLLAKRNHGSFDSTAVYQMIDGRNARATHRKIPKRVVSAMKRRESELDTLLDLPCGSEEAVRDRILSIVDYLGQLQTK